MISSNYELLKTSKKIILQLLKILWHFNRNFFLNREAIITLEKIFPLLGVSFAFFFARFASKQQRKESPQFIIFYCSVSSLLLLFPFRRKMCRNVVTFQLTIRWRNVDDFSSYLVLDQVVNFAGQYCISRHRHSNVENRSGEFGISWKV